MQRNRQVDRGFSAIGLFVAISILTSAGIALTLTTIPHPLQTVRGVAASVASAIYGDITSLAFPWRSAVSVPTRNLSRLRSSRDAQAAAALATSQAVMPTASVPAATTTQDPTVNPAAYTKPSAAQMTSRPTRASGPQYLTVAVATAGNRSSASSTSESGLVLATATSSTDAVTHAELNAALTQLRTELAQPFALSGPPATTPISTQAFAASQKIDNLSGVTISNSTIDTASIPDLSGTYLSLSGGSIPGAVSFGHTATSTFTTVGWLGIGTSSPTTQLDVPGQSPSAELSYASVTSPRSVFVQANYLYVASSDDVLRIFDITDPSTLTLVGSASEHSDGHDLYVAGSLAFITDGSGNVSIVDVSDPANPKEIYHSGLNTTWVGRVAVQGKYLYTVGSANRQLTIYDISNPRAPRQIGISASLPPASYSEVFIDVQGNYAYLSTNTELTIVDISNPSSPQLLGSLVLGGAVQSIKVDGRYAYLANESSKALDIVDISSTTAPTLVSRLSLGVNPFSLTKQGRYAYITDYGGNMIYVVNVSDPTSPWLVGSIDADPISWGSRSLAVQGHYVYQASNASNVVQVFDLGGANLQSLQSGTIETTDLSVARDLQIGHNITLRGGITAGEGLLASAASAVFASTTDSAFTITQNVSSGNILDLYSGSGKVFSVLGSGDVGIGTPSPSTFKLQVKGNIGPDASNSYNLGAAGSNWGCLYYNGGTTGTCASDQRLKTDIQPLTFDTASSTALDQVAGLTLHSFAYKTATSSIYHGLIAQEVQQVAPELVAEDASTTLLSVKYGDVQWLVVQALQELIAKINDLTNTVAGFVEQFATKDLTFTRALGDELTVNKIRTQQLCADRSDGTSICVTGDQLTAFLAQAGGGAAPASTSLSTAPDLANSAATTSVNSSTPTLAPGTPQPPVIQINGENPAVIHVGDAYNDLGATIVAPNADKKLGIKTFLNRKLVSNIVVDTTVAATDTIDYVVSDPTGRTATSTRTVIIETSTAASSTPPVSARTAVFVAQTTNSTARVDSQTGTSTPQ